MKQGDGVPARGAGGPVERGGSQLGTYTEVSVLASEWFILMSGWGSGCPTVYPSLGLSNRPHRLLNFLMASLAARG